MTVSARSSGLDIFKAAPGASIKPASYSTGQLADFVSRGLACRLSDGHVAAVVDPQDLNYWIAQAKGAYGKGTPEDSGTLRSLLTKRASALGLSHLIGSWSVPQSSADTGTKAAVVRAAGARQVAIAKATVEDLARNVREADGSTEVGRAYTEALRLERKANQVSDPVTAAGYRALAKQRYEEAGLCR